MGTINKMQTTRSIIISGVPNIAACAKFIKQTKLNVK